jgi:hypothetical protein
VLLLYKKFKSIRNGLLAIGFLGLLGCHSGQMPNAPDLSAETSATSSQSVAPSFRIALTPFALHKTVGEQTSSPTKTKRIGILGGLINIVHEKTKATFMVPPMALNQRTDISMQIHGSGASAIVEFGPDGLVFNKPALLALTFSAEDVDPESLGGYLVEEDGTYTPVGHRIIVKNNTITILIKIAHFSEYTGDGGDESVYDDIDIYDEPPILE